MIKLISFLAILACSSLAAKTINISVVDKDGMGLPQTVVYFENDSTKQSPAGPIEASAIMDQVNSQFSPHILAVQKGTSVSFPNSDSIKHHVYSFSPSKTFELRLYKGIQSDPELFSKSGIVELGCNVHDWMLGYIYVVETPYFAQTDADGNVTIDVPDAQYEVKIWNPRIQDEPKQLVQSITTQTQSSVKFLLTADLLDAHNDLEDQIDEFSEYD